MSDDKRRSLKVALIQHRDHGNREANHEHLQTALAQAAGDGAQLVLLQELHNGPYFCQNEDPARFDEAEPLDGRTRRMLSQAAREHGLVIVGSIFEKRAAGVYHNTAIVLDSDGSLAGYYRKMHIPEDPGYHEKFYFTPGDGDFDPIDTSIGRLGVLVCWDQWYPEAARLMALAGAEMLLYPTAIGWDPQDDEEEQARQLEAWQTVQRGHAVANGIPVLACNRVGHEADPSGRGPGQSFWGNSFVAGVQGELLGKAPGDEECVLIIELDLSRSEAIRRIWPFLRDRRIDAYGELDRRTRS